jgi:hypothetical protein
MTTHAMPTRSAEQRLTAIRLANQVRFERARLKRQLRDTPAEESAWMAAGILSEPPDWAQTMRIYELLIQIPKWGRVKVERLLLKLGIAQHKRVGGLSPRQRKLLVEALTQRAVRR